MPKKRARSPSSFRPTSFQRNRDLDARISERAQERGIGGALIPPKNVIEFVDEIEDFELGAASASHAGSAKFDTVLIFSRTKARRLPDRKVLERAAIKTATPH